MSTGGQRFWTPPIPVSTLFMYGMNDRVRTLVVRPYSVLLPSHRLRNRSMKVSVGKNMWSHKRNTRIDQSSCFAAQPERRRHRTTPMGTAQSRTAHKAAQSHTEHETAQIRVPVIRFRVLVLGRANAGKTSILQRVCETTESPTIYRGNQEVRFMVQPIVYVSDLTTDRLHLNRQWMLVRAVLLVSRP